MVLYTCQLCNKPFTNKTDYTRHLQSHQRKQAKEEEKRMIENQKDKKTNICDDCGDGFCNKYVLQKHKINSCKYRVNNIINNVYEIINS